MNSVIALVPGRRAESRLLGILLERAKKEYFAFIHPALITAGAYLELLYDLQRPFSSDIAQQLTWTRAVKETGRMLV